MGVANRGRNFYAGLAFSPPPPDHFLELFKRDFLHIDVSQCSSPRTPTFA